MEPSWRERDAEAIEIKHGTGPLRGFVRQQHEGETCWVGAQTREPGKLGPIVKDGERLTPDELLAALRGPLGA